MRDDRRSSDAGRPPAVGEILLSHLCHAPRRTVFDAWSRIEMLRRWWGPAGSTWVTGTQEFSPGGKFHFCLRSPDGTEVWGRFVYRDIVPIELISFIVSFSDSAGRIARHPAIATWPLEVYNGIVLTEHRTSTLLTIRGYPVHASEEEARTLVAARPAIEESMRGSFARLDEYLASRTREEVNDAREPGYVLISRTFAASPETLWKAWTECGVFRQWWGPKKYSCPSCRIDAKVGGKYLACMRSPDGKDTWSTGEYREVVERTRLVYTDNFSDGTGKIVPASYYGFRGEWPGELQVTITFEPARIGTRMVLRHVGFPDHETAAQAQAGWNESFDKLERVVKDISRTAKRNA